jgi:hypothetical protein
MEVSGISHPSLEVLSSLNVRIMNTGYETQMIRSSFQSTEFTSKSSACLAKVDLPLCGVHVAKTCCDIDGCDGGMRSLALHLSAISLSACLSKCKNNKYRLRISKSNKIKDSFGVTNKGVGTWEYCSQAQAGTHIFQQ